jgi:hypothetical protein
VQLLRAGRGNPPSDVDGPSGGRAPQGLLLQRV